MKLSKEGSRERMASSAFVQNGRKSAGGGRSASASGSSWAFSCLIAQAGRWERVLYRVTTLRGGGGAGGATGGGGGRAGPCGADDWAKADSHASLASSYSVPG